MNCGICFHAIMPPDKGLLVNMKGDTLVHQACFDKLSDVDKQGTETGRYPPRHA